MKPLITVSIPTRNSGRTLRICLKALKAQTYKNFEVNIVDKESIDDTVTIARKYRVKKILTVKSSLLQARYEGAKVANGNYVLILDSDQILAKDALEKAVKLIKSKKFEMLVFEEFVYRNKTFLERLFACDRMLINSVNDLSPFTGVIMPRFFKKSLLLRAYGNIPSKVFPNTGGPDHAIVYYESWKLSKKIGIVSKAVSHMEPSTLRELLPKFFRWGYTSVDVRFGKYATLMDKKERLRTGLFSKGLIIESLGSITLLIFKYIAFKCGLYMGKIDRKLGIARRY